MVSINTSGTANSENVAASSTSDYKPRVAVIGAGSSGLTAMKQCLDDNLEPVCFEQNSHVGGLWKYEEIDEKNKDPHSSVFRTTVINTSKETMTFSDYPIPHDWPTYLPHHLVLKYFEMYAEHFKLDQYIKFRTNVLRVSNLSDDRWKHRWPKYEGMDNFGGQQIHSHFYRDTKAFENKRVIIVGCGNSGMDISVELSTIASQAYIVARRGTLPWILPRLAIFGIPPDHLDNRFLHFLPSKLQNFLREKLSYFTVGPPPPGLEPKYPISAHHATIKTELYERLSTGTLIVKQNIAKLNEDKSVEFVDGTRIEDIDVIIYCTGYHISFPFLDGEILTGGKEIEKFDPEYRENLAWLYKLVFPPRYKNIAFLGLVQPNGPIFPVTELQARYATSIIRGHITPPSPERMDQWVENYQNFLQKTFYSSARHTVESPFVEMMDLLAKDIGCLPTSKEVFLKYGFKAWRNYFFGIITPIQYRLFGRHSWDKAVEWMNIYNGGQSYAVIGNGVALETGKKDQDKKYD
ncbi:6869_t:CDS:2 [Ambispora gerdemannii]|uniref:6869_t:CDS:1 n=1 Tax=Ambispora gerdemannii TaxID=144530 RepID=A0A9N9F6N8_9GLOM|nr:6869_t:CDS:2 [Ambispora gerdemannii]